MWIRRESWILRYVYSLSSGRFYDNTINLCSLFWQLVAVTMGWGAIICLVSLLICALFVVPIIELGWWGLLLTPGIAGLAIGCASVTKYVSSKRLKPLSRERQPSIIVAFIKAKKERLCPIVEIRE